YMDKIGLHPDFKDFLRLLNSRGVNYLRRQMGSPIKGPVKRKNTSPSKKYIFFRLSSYFRTSTASLYYHLFSHPLFLFHRFSVSTLELIRTSHPSGSRQLCFKRNA
ncbi:MAG: hypothetical protein KKH20_11630, partial [Proteobacteria bacterium]|nr:hypothetical protein [Pseudomonadota bacterium]